MSSASEKLKAASERVAADVAVTATNVDPIPHFVMSGACALASGFAYSRLANPQAAAFAALFSAGYYFAGYYLNRGQHRFGYDLGTLTSMALLASVGPRAYYVGEGYSTALASLAGVSLLGNGLKSYQHRTGLPSEVHAHSPPR